MYNEPSVGYCNIWKNLEYMGLKFFLHLHADPYTIPYTILKGTYCMCRLVKRQVFWCLSTVVTAKYSFISESL